MNCDDFSAAIGDEVEGRRHDDERRAALAEHAATCAACRAMQADLRAIRQAATLLDRQPAPADGWTRLARRLASEPAPRAFRTWSRVRPWLAAAALLMVVAGGGLLVWRARPVAPPQQVAGTVPTAAGAKAGTSRAGASPQSIETELRLAEQHYEKAIAGLEAITREGGRELDPNTAAVLQKNLRVIDDAIDESRAALQQQPTSRVAQDSLFDALKNKVALLQDSISLINEMRKGDQEGAARIVQGLTR